VLARVAVRSVPKRGSTRDECEDACLVDPDPGGGSEIEASSMIAAVADGASESMLAGRWARRLVATIAGAPRATRTRSGFLAAYAAATAAFEREVADYTEERAARGSPIQWYEEPGLAKGAHATILAVELLEPPRAQRQRWRAVAIGDSCLFHVRDGDLLASFPMRDAGSFSHQPPLLPSRGAAEDAVARHVRLRSGDWQKGDVFYLATDALAAWFLGGSHGGGRPWEALDGTLDGADGTGGGAGIAFGRWVEELRDGRDLHDDDTTLVRIEVR
jgi:hypothetical protein